MITRFDYQLSLAIGACIGILLLPIVFILEIHFPYRIISTILIPVIIIPIGLRFGSFLQESINIGARFSKYVSAGLLSFSIDFALLNIMSYMTGITAGFTVGWINIPGFFFATMNAYFWNKFWVFQKHTNSKIFDHLPKFLFVIIIGIIINSIVVIAISSAIAPPLGISSQRWLNIAKTIATAVAVMWNFFGYKFIAFKE